MDQKKIILLIAGALMATGLYAFSSGDIGTKTQDRSNEKLGSLETPKSTIQDNSGMYENDNNENKYTSEVTIPSTIKRYRHEKKVVIRYVHPPCPPGGGGGADENACTDLLSAWQMTGQTKREGSNRYQTLYGFRIHMTEDGGRLGGGNDVYAVLESCPLGDQGIYLHNMVQNRACGGYLSYDTVWKGGIRSYRKFWFKYTPIPCSNNQSQTTATPAPTPSPSTGLLSWWTKNNTNEGIAPIFGIRK